MDVGSGFWDLEFGKLSIWTEISREIADIVFWTRFDIGKDHLGGAKTEHGSNPSEKKEPFLSAFAGPETSKSSTVWGLDFSNVDFRERDVGYRV